MHLLHLRFLLGITLAAGTASGAGIQMTEVDVSDSGKSRAEMLVDGDRFKISYSEAPMGMPAGCYMLGTGPGQMFMVVPSRNAYARFDKAEFSGMAQKHAEANDGEQGSSGMKRTVEDFLLKKELDEAGPAMFGLSTRHYRYTLSYKEVMKMPGTPMAMTTKVSETHEFWATQDLADAIAMSAWQAEAPAATGNEAADKNAEASRTMDEHGMKLKSIVTRKSTVGGMGGMAGMMGGKRGDTSTSKREVVAFARVDVPADTFVLPEGFQETDVMGLFAGGGSRMPDLNAPDGQSKPRSAMPNLNDPP